MAEEIINDPIRVQTEVEFSGTKEIFKNARSAIFGFVDDRESVDYLSGKWHAVYDQQKREKDAFGESGLDNPFDQDSWSQKVLDAITGEAWGFYTSNNRVKSKVEKYEEDDPTSVDNALSAGDEIVKTYETGIEELVKKIRETSNTVGIPEFKSIYPEGSIDRRRLQALLDAIEIFAEQDLSKDVDGSWAKNIFVKLGEMTTALQGCVAAKNEVVNAAN